MSAVMDTFWSGANRHIVNFLFLLEKYRDGFIVGGKKEGWVDPDTLDTKQYKLKQLLD